MAKGFSAAQAKAKKKRKKKKLSEMKIVLYLRKSSEEEEKQFNSTEDQKKICLNYAKKIEDDTGQKLNIVKTYEEHCSAAHAGKRMYFNEMIKGIKLGKYDAILAYHPDRLSRNMLEAGKLLDMVRPDMGEEVGVLQDMLFPTVSFNNDSGGRLMLAVLFSMATQYSDHLSEVVQRGVDSTVERGKSPGVTKWGYTTNTVTRYFEPDDNFDIIRKGWDMILQGKSQAEVLEFWKDNDVHYDTVEVANKQSRKIKLQHKTQVARILRDPFYYGVLIYGAKSVDLRDIPEANFEPMITEHEYDKVQAKLDSGYQTHRKAKGPSLFIPFQGMIICKECGHKMYGYANHKRKLIYYGHQKKAVTEGCSRYKNSKANKISKEIRGKVILDEIYKVIDTLAPTKADYDHYLKVASDYTDERKEELQHELASKRGSISAYQASLREEASNYTALTKQSKTPKVVLEQIADKIEELNENISRLEEEIKELKEKLSRPEQAIMKEKEFLNMLKNAKKQIRKTDFVGKDIIVRNLFLNIEIDEKNRATFLCKPEFSGLFKSPNVHVGGDMWT